MWILQRMPERCRDRGEYEFLSRSRTKGDEVEKPETQNGQAGTIVSEPEKRKRKHGKFRKHQDTMKDRNRSSSKEPTQKGE